MMDVLCLLCSEQGAFKVGLPLIRQQTQGARSASPPPYLSPALLHAHPAPKGPYLGAKAQGSRARGSRGCPRAEQQPHKQELLMPSTPEGF